MTFVLSIDYGMSNQPYYVSDCPDDTTFNEIYDPQFATEFSTKNKALDWARSNTDLMQYITAVNTKKAIAKYNEWAAQGSIRCTRVKVNKDHSRPYNGESKEDILDWWHWTTTHPYITKQVDYNTWPKLRSQFKHLWEWSHYENNTITMEIYTTKTGDFETFNQELNLVLNKITYKTETGCLVFPIFDHKLSFGGNSADLIYDPNTGKSEVTGRFVQESFDTLEETFDFIRRERYYE